MAGNWTIRGYANLWTANSRAGQVADWTTCGIVDAAGISTYCFNCMIRLCGHIIQLTESLA